MCLREPKYLDNVILIFNHLKNKWEFLFNIRKWYTLYFSSWTYIHPTSPHNFVLMIFIFILESLLLITLPYFFCNKGGLQMVSG